MELRLEYWKRSDIQQRMNPENWRVHPEEQVAALSEALSKVGWADALLLNETTGRLIDGHARAEHGDPNEELPVLIGQWTEKQEKELLASLDPMAEFAEVSREKLTALLEEMADEDGAVGSLFDDMAEEHELIFRNMALDLEDDEDAFEEEDTAAAGNWDGDVDRMFDGRGNQAGSSNDTDNETDDDELEDEEAADSADSSQPSGGVQPTVMPDGAIRMIQAVFRKPTDEQFKARCQQLAGRYGTETLSDTALAILEDAAAKFTDTAE